MNTLATLIERHGVDVEEHLDRDLSVPVRTDLQIQGDVAIIPTRPGKSARKSVRVPREGIPVVRGEAGGNTHLLLADGNVTWDAMTTGTAELGTVTVPDGATAYLAHPQHGYMGLGAGTYRIRRQRQQADVIRMVAD